MTSPVTTPERGVLKRLYHGETHADIVHRWKLWFALSGVVLLIGATALATRGLNMGIDFTGGTVWEVPAGKAEVADVTEAMADLGYDDVQVQEVTQATGGDDVRLLRVEAEATAETDPETDAALDRTSSALGRVIDDLPESTRGIVGTLRDNLDGIDGPFEDQVPEPLAALQDEVDALPDSVDAAKGNEAKEDAVRASVAEMRGHVDELARLESAERTRLGRDVTERLSDLTGTPAAQVTVDTVGPSWGKQISDKARSALVVFMIAITIFITIRFELKMALATVAALFHDLLVVVGMYALFSFPVTPATVVALLTMLGFSIYDGIVVFDRINENTKFASRKSKMTYTDMANRSLNQVLMRSLNTSITSLLPILSVLIVGAFVLEAGSLEEFGLALFLGLMSGAYSSIFIATPLLALLKEREPKYRELREHLAGGQGGSDDESVADDTEPALVGAGPNLAAPGSAPRPRKPRKR